MNSLLNMLPYHLKDDISYYLWRMRMNDVVTHFDRVFLDLMSDGRVWIKYKSLSERDTRYERIGGMIGFNFRILDDDLDYVKSISRIYENKNGLYELINHDIFIIKNDRLIKECIFWPLSPNY
jgi:hypothetical protein